MSRPCRTAWAWLGTLARWLFMPTLLTRSVRSRDLPGGRLLAVAQLLSGWGTWP